MLKLYLLRHAQAESGFDKGDKQRLLTDHGIKQAGHVAKQLPVINKSICSNAIRTKMTQEALESAGAQIENVIYSDDLYNAPAGNILSAIQDSGTAQSLLIIAHNPGIHHLANMLAIENDDVNRERLMFDYAPATLSVLECPIENWKDIQNNQNTLVDLFIPD